MLKFTRNKLVSVAKKDQETLQVHGVLDDVIYGLELDISVRISDMTILEIQGKWNRWTTPECPRSLPFLEEAVGFCMQDQGITQKIHKIIGRKSCRHFATLLIECCESVKQAVQIIRWEAARVKTPDLSFEEFLTGHAQDSPAPDETSDQETETPGKPADAESDVTSRVHVGDGEPVSPSDKKPEGFFIDLHTHTSPASPCSSASQDHLIEEAKRIGLDGICLTDHNYIWEAGQAEELSRKHSFLVLRGNEITTEQGHILVFGLDKPVQSSGIIKLEELREEVVKADGFMIVAHPFRGFLTFGVGQLGLTVTKALERPFFKYIDAVEVMNGKVTEKENAFASQVADEARLRTTGGSDAHEVNEVGVYATRFSDPVTNEKDLLNALKNGNYSAVAFRREYA